MELLQKNGPVPSKCDVESKFALPWGWNVGIALLKRLHDAFGPRPMIEGPA